MAAEGVSTGIDGVELAFEVESQTSFVDPGSPQAEVRKAVARVRSGGVGVVVVLGDGPAAQELARFVPSLPETRFVFLDASLAVLSLEGVSNAAAIRFAEEDVLYLAGYLSGLVPTLDRSRRRVDMVSVVADEPDREAARLISGFRRGLRQTNPGAKVRVDYSGELVDHTACERLSNHQIDEGSDVVLAIAGKCGLGAVAVARTRGVWAIGAEEDGVRPPDVLLATHKEWAIATQWAVARLLDKTLSLGRDTVLGLEDDYTVGLWFTDNVPERVESAVIRECSVIRLTKHRDF